MIRHLNPIKDAGPYTLLTRMIICVSVVLCQVALAHLARVLVSITVPEESSTVVLQTTLLLRIALTLRGPSGGHCVELHC